jgi:hypothetical protein
MLKIDIVNKVVCKNFDKFDNLERGFLSQNIITQLRNFAERIPLKVYSHGQDIEVSYLNIEKAMIYVKSNGDFNFFVE